MKPLEENNFKNANISNMYNQHNITAANLSNGSSTILSKQKSYYSSSLVNNSSSPSSLSSSATTMHSFDCYSHNSASSTFNLISKENNTSYFNSLPPPPPPPMDGQLNASEYENSSVRCLPAHCEPFSKTAGSSSLTSGPYIPPPSLSSFIQNNSNCGSGGGKKSGKKSAKDTSKLTSLKYEIYI
jgi:hypothetical protein